MFMTEFQVGEQMVVKNTGVAWTQLLRPKIIIGFVNIFIEDCLGGLHLEPDKMIV